MSKPPPTFFLYSSLDKNPNVGIWLSTQERQRQEVVADQPVRLQADLVRWVAALPIIPDSSPIGLGPRPYKYTTELKGQVYATSDPRKDRKWWLTFIPRPDDQIYVIIASDPEREYVWTAGEPGKPIRIEQFAPGGRSQVFKIVPVIKTNE